MVRVEEIEASIKEAAEGKTKRGTVRRALAQIHERAEAIRHSLLTGQWHPCKHPTHYIQEGTHRKRRNIIKPRWYHEQIVHHMIARQLAKIYGPRMYFYSAGTVKAPGAKKGHGPLFCRRVITRWRNEYEGKKFYCAELDIASFFDSIDIDVLKTLLKKRIRDKRFLDLLFEILDNDSPGIPKGFYISPWLAQVYLFELDNYIKQVLRPDHYMRFVDNYFIMHRNKKELRKIVCCIENYLGEKLHLRLNGSKQIYRMEYEASVYQMERIARRDAELGISRKRNRIRGRPVACLGYVIHRNRVTMRKSILKRARGKALRIHRLHRCTVHDASTMLSYKGWFRQTDTRGYFEKWIRPNVSLRYCRKRVSNSAKKKAKKLKEEKSNGK